MYSSINFSQLAQLKELNNKQNIYHVRMNLYKIVILKKKQIDN